MAKYVISASPLVTMYLEEWHDRLLEAPDLIFENKEDFAFDVKSGCGAVAKLRFNKPFNVADIKGRSDKELDMIYGWMIGEAGHSYHETDQYGIVPFDPGVDLVERQDEMAQLDNLMSDDPKVVAETQKKIARIQKDTAARLRTMRESVKKASEARILRAAKTVHNNLMRQWQINEEMKLGKYPPSISEMLGAHALDKQIKAAAQKGAVLKEKMNSLMGGTFNV